MKRLIASIEEHVAFYGPNGCDVESLWPVMQAIETTKSKCWRVLVGMKSLEFYNDNQKLDRPRDMKLEHADSIRIVAPAELRKKVLLRYAPNSNLSLNANQFAVLDKIANTRRDGILQIQVARELGVDSRAVYPVIKRLEEQGLIIKTRVSTNKTWTNLLHHIRFSPDEMVNTPTMDLQGIIHYDTLQKRLVNVLSEAKDDMIPMAELFKIFGFTTKQQKKWMSRFFVRAIDEGYIEKKRLMIDGIKTVCIKLLHSPIQKEEQEAAPKPEEDTESSSSKKRKRQYGQLYGKELQDRIVQVIGEADDKGMTRRQVEHALPEATPSAIKHFLKSIISMNNDNNKVQQLFHVIEAQGRGRCYRYFTRAGLDAFLRNRGQTLAGPNHDQEGCADENETSAAVPEEQDTTSTSNGTKRALTTTTNETPPPSKRVKTVTEGGFTKGTRQSMKGTNVTMDNRRNAMATIVLRDKVRELHGDLREEIMVQAGEAESNHVIARATLMRMAERLEKSNVIRIMKTAVPTMTGAIETKILLLHPDVGDNDEIVKQYMERLRMNRMVKPIVCRKLPELEVYERGESAATSSTSNEMTPRQHAALQKVYGAPDKYWREVALRHGWLSSRWLRARVLHEYLFDQKNNMNAVDFGNVISHMPLDVYRKAFGICSYSEDAEEFLRNNDNPEIPLSMIPSNLHPTIITSTSRLRHRLFKLLAILEALELMEPHTLTRPTTTEERPTITLTRMGRIRNFLDTSRPILKEIEFHTLDNVKSFWDELQFTCTCEHTRTTGTPRGQGEKEDLLSSITISRTWGIHILLNPQQRQLLESHVDRTKGKAPCDDDKLILHLSRQVSLAPSRVKRYFEGIVRLHHGGPSSGRSARKTRPPELVSNLIKSAISGESVQAYKSNNIEQTFTPTRRYLRHRFPTSNTGDLARPKKYRKWQKTEQDVLIHAFTIMRQRADALHIPIAWRPIEQVLPGWDYETCRRRLHHMKSHSPHLGQDLINLKQQWIKIYNEGIQSGELVDDRPWDVVDFDLPGQLEYFVTKLHASPVQINASLDRLPDHRQELLRLYTIAPRIPYQHMESMLTVHGDRRNLQHDPASTRITHIAVLIKMVLLTATSDYDPKIAHALLERFSQQETMDATRYLRDAGVLIKNRSFGANRMIPGRQYNFSEKFLKKFTCSFYPSRLLQQSSDFYQGLKPQTDLIQDQISGGAMAVILDMLSTGQVELNMKNEEQYFQAHYNSTLAEVVDDDLSAKWINQGFDVILNTTNKPFISHEQHAESFDTGISMPSMEAVDALDSDTRSVYDLIDDCGKDGATLPLLKGQLDIPDSKIVQATQQLISGSLIIRVGFSDLRLVSFRHVDHWTVPLDDNTHFHPRMWRNIHGKTIPTVLEGCAEAVLQHILSTPGIKQSQLCNIFEGYMARAEIMDVLQYLEQRHTIKSKQFHETKKVGLFGRRLFSKSLDNDKIAHDSIIHYWPLSGYYKSIQVSR
ncbi:hypothetical protein RO3G_13952 [Lichtheimia corymbifera JMRC:FSU:9682]|uniref:Uncharacterized protein n=1 Tax=Lichtheimia corymbifera JMRC:FSU:9682 TaxID=1263082 RepID=A0A068S5G6_9FUNG|nr:hypothetical protein RO3G_13952 [Lichtheimia corymbifera JMRC:FSU:9682]